MKKIVFALISLFLLSMSSSMSASNEPNVANAESSTVFVYLQLGGTDISDIGSSVTYIRNGIRYTEAFSENRMSYSFTVDKGTVLSFNFLILGGDTYSIKVRESGVAETKEIESGMYGSPFTGSPSFRINDINEIYFNFSSNQ